MQRPTRRDALKLTGFAAGLALGLPALPARAGLSLPARPDRRRIARVAHLTDVHVQPERRAGDGLAACLRHVRELKDKPDLIITGGDHVYDSCEADEARTKLQWELWSKVVKDECAIPIQSCLGNHDAWGWNKTRSKTTGEEALYGKKWAMDVLKIPQRYRSLDLPAAGGGEGWHIVVLDSIFPQGDSYIGQLDEEQFEWLKGDLAAADPNVPVMVVSHIPILAVCVFFKGGPERSTDVAPARMHTDAGRLKDLFLKHPNVKLCISGHIHLVDHVTYDGVTYLCNGAVSGNWWKGRHQECEEGYALLDLFNDGSFERQYVAYGWKA